MGGLTQRWREIRPALVSDLLYFVVRLIGATLRVRVVNPPETFDRCVVCGWHGRSLVFGNHFRSRGFCVVISLSRDGEIQNRIFSRLGYRTIRGSTGRGGARALAESIRALKGGGTMAMTPDGPRGPSGVVQPGVVLMAQRSGASLLPVGVSARPRWLAGSWDRYMIPLPFARAIVRFGSPIAVPSTAGDEELEVFRLSLEQQMHQLQAEAELDLGIPQ